MSSKYTLNVSLTEHLYALVASQVSSGRFGTASEVVRAGLRLLERELSALTSIDPLGGIRTELAVAAAVGEKMGQSGLSGKTCDGA